MYACLKRSNFLNAHVLDTAPHRCRSLPCLDMESFPVLNQIKPQAPLLVAPFRQFLQSSAVRPYTTTKLKDFDVF